MPRATATATITFGLVSIPVKLYVAASDESISFNMITPEGNRAKQKYVDSVSGAEVAQTACLKGYEHAKGQYVIFTREELEALELRTTKTIDITEFVPASTLDYLFVERNYYLGPDKGADKGYLLLSEAMEAQGKVAIAQWVSKGKAHLVAIRPYRKGLILQILWYREEVRDFNEIEIAAVQVLDAERKLAIKLIDTLTSDEFEPEKYEDIYAKALREMVDAKVAGKNIIVPQDGPAGSATALDLFAALKNSLSETAESPKGKRTSPKAPKKARAKK